MPERCKVYILYSVYFMNIICVFFQIDFVYNIGIPCIEVYDAASAV